MIDLELNGTKLPVYIAQPSGDIKGGLIVIHEVWGLANHIKTVADRFAAEGYLSLAPDLLSGTGLSEEFFGTLQKDLFDPAKRTAAQPKLREMMAPIQAPGFAETTVENLKQCFDYLYKQESTGQKVASIGFCFGGSYSFSLAVHEPRLKAALPFYGHADFSVDELKKIKCPIMAFYGENDERLMESLPKLEADMKAAGVDLTVKVYPNCGHAFFNDSNPHAYNQEAAQDAMAKSLTFLAANLS